MSKKWSLNLTTLTLNQVIKFDYNIKNVIYFEAENWREADKFVSIILHRPGPSPEKKLIPAEVEKAIVELCKN